MLKLFVILTLSLLIFSCQKNAPKEEYASRFHEDGRAMPMVLLLPVIDSTSYEAKWSISDELSTLVRQKLVRKHALYLPKFDEKNSSLGFQQSPFSSDVSWMKDAFKSAEFVVFLELVEHANIPVGKAPIVKIMDAEKIRDQSTNLNMATRVRVVDLRGKEPKIVLQELVTDSYFISKNHIDTDYSHLVWGMEEYNTSPMGMAHNQLAKEIAERIQAYILLAQSR